MNDERSETGSSIETDLEDAIDETRSGVLAADATGMLSNEQFITVTELREGDVTPPV
jgi:hypothetical protein